MAAHALLARRSASTSRQYACWAATTGRRLAAPPRYGLSRWAESRDAIEAAPTPPAPAPSAAAPGSGAVDEEPPPERAAWRPASRRARPSSAAPPQPRVVPAAPREGGALDSRLAPSTTGCARAGTTSRALSELVVMPDARSGDDSHDVAVQPEPQPEVEVLAIHEVALVELAHPLPSLPPHAEGSARGKVDLGMAHPARRRGASRNDRPNPYPGSG